MCVRVLYQVDAASVFRATTFLLLMLSHLCLFMSPDLLNDRLQFARVSSRKIFLGGKLPAQLIVA